MKYKFVSKEQARNDWENGRVQIEHLGKGESDKLNKLLKIITTSSLGGKYNYYKYKCVSMHEFINLCIVPTDELWEMIFGEYQQEIGNIWKELWDAKYGEYQQEDLSSNLSKIQDEIIGYELNGKVKPVHMTMFLDCDEWKCYTRDFPLMVGTHDYIIKRAKDLGILSTCFNPIYKQKEVMIEIPTTTPCRTVMVNVTKDWIDFGHFIAKITDIQKILDAHNKL